MTTPAMTDLLRRHPVLVVGLLAVLLGGCSTFERDWRAAAGPTSAETGLAGRWQGTWRSDENGHDGGLRCIISSDGSGALVARYHATYGWFFTFEYEMPMAARQDGDGWRFDAEADLGWLAGGRYRYEGSVAGDDFVSTYACARDRGVFEMRRVRD